MLGEASDAPSARLARWKRHVAETQEHVACYLLALDQLAQPGLSTAEEALRDGRLTLVKDVPAGAFIAYVSHRFGGDAEHLRLLLHKHISELVASVASSSPRVFVYCPAFCIPRMSTRTRTKEANRAELLVRRDRLQPTPYLGDRSRSTLPPLSYA